MSEKCEGCRFWLLLPHFAERPNHPGRRGACRIRAPRETADYPDYEGFPRVMWDGWCGEFQPAKGGNP